MRQECANKADKKYQRKKLCLGPKYRSPVMNFVECI